MQPDRVCCDGRCTKGQACPATLRGFAPGVIDGPARRPWWGRTLRRAVGQALPWATLGLLGCMALAGVSWLALVVWRVGVPL